MVQSYWVQENFRELGCLKGNARFMKNEIWKCFIYLWLNLFFCIISWFGLLTLKNNNRLLGIIRVCGKVADTTLNDLSQVHIVRILKKARTVLVSSCCFHLDADSARPVKQITRYVAIFIPVATEFFVLANSLDCSLLLFTVHCLFPVLIDF